MTTNYKKAWRFECRNDSAEIFLYDQIGSDAFGEGVTGAAFVADLKALGALREITVRISSPGGSVADGLLIFNALVENPARIITRIDSMAASVASVIAMAGDRVLMASNGLFMIHDPTVSVYGGDANELRRMASVLDKVRASIIAAYQRHTKMRSAEIAALMAEETWFDSSAALAAGFVDEVLSEQGDLQGVAAKADLTKFHNLPAQLIAARARKADPVPSYAPLYPTRSFEELQTDHERLLLAKRLRDLKYR